LETFRVWAAELFGANVGFGRTEGRLGDDGEGFDVKPAYEMWDAKYRSEGKGRRIVERNTAYQVEEGGEGAHAAERYPCTVSLRE
jgi:hypothetical protein